MKFVKLVRDYENKKYKDVSYSVKNYILYTRCNPLLNSWGLLPVPGRLWLCDNDSDTTFARPLDGLLSSDSSGVLVRRPACLVRTRTRWQLNPRGVYRLHGSGGCTGAERGSIKEFSRASQTRLQRCIDSYDVKWGSFITLTFSAAYCEERRTLKNGARVPVGRWSPSWNTGHGDFLHSFAVRFDKKTRSFESDTGQDVNGAFLKMRAFLRHITECRGYRQTLKPPLFIWKKEFTARGVIHFHILCTSKLKRYVRRLQRKWAEICGNDFDNSLQIDDLKQDSENQKGVGFYLAKYMKKSEKETNGFCCSAPLGLCFGFLGRWWGVVNRKYWKDCIVEPVKFPLYSGLFKSLFVQFLDLICGDIGEHAGRAFRSRVASARFPDRSRSIGSASRPFYYSLWCWRSHAHDSAIGGLVAGGGDSPDVRLYDDVEDKRVCALSALPF